MPFKPPLAPTNIDVTLTFGSAPTITLPWFDGITGYGGQPLFCHAFSAGNTLSLLFDDVPANDVQSNTTPLYAADNVTATFMLGGTVLYSWEPTAYHYPGGSSLNFYATMSPSLGTLHLFVDDKPVAARSASAGHTDGVVSFVLVRQIDQDYRFVWIHDNTAVIADADTLTDATVVRPNPSIISGSITGPMGFTTP